MGFKRHTHFHFIIVLTSQRCVGYRHRRSRMRKVRFPSLADVQCPISTGPKHPSAWPARAWLVEGERRGGRVSFVDGDHVFGREWKLRAKPKLVVLGDGIGFVI